MVKSFALASALLVGHIAVGMAADPPTAGSEAAASAAPAATPTKPARHKRDDARFRKADKDGDGSLDKDEAKGMPRIAHHFDKIDADHDGTVTREEIHDFMKAHHRKHTAHKAGMSPAPATPDGAAPPPPAEK